MRNKLLVFNLIVLLGNVVEEPVIKSNSDFCLFKIKIARPLFHFYSQIHFDTLEIQTYKFIAKQSKIRVGNLVALRGRILTKQLDISIFADYIAVLN